MEAIKSFVENYLKWLSLPDISITDLLEIFIIAYFIYHVVIWVKDTRAWMLMKGLVVILLFSLVATVFEFNVILYILSKSISVGIIAIIIIFQPELRRALEQLGRKNLVMSIIAFDDTKDKNERFSNRTVSEIVRASFELAKTKTGALMVIEQEIMLSEYERTGITLDSVISSQLLINIFEHNTPLHDGAVILRENRVISATCYLPLSDNMRLSKDLGTRHRAGVGISEVSDSVTIIVSEETGGVSIAFGGKLERNLDSEQLRARLERIQKKNSDVTKLKKLWRGRQKNEKKVDK